MISVVNITWAADLSQLFSQVKSDLLQKGVAASDVNTIQPVVTNLLGAGVSKQNLVGIVTNLVALKVKGNALNSPLQTLSGLVQSGQQPSIASNLMSLVINQAKTQNLTVNSAVSKITDFINQKKADFLSLKQTAQGKIQDQKNRVSSSLGSFLGK